MSFFFVSSHFFLDDVGKNEDMDEDEDEDEENWCQDKRRSALKGGFIKGQWTREEDEKVYVLYVYIYIHTYIHINTCIHKWTREKDVIYVYAY